MLLLAWILPSLITLFLTSIVLYPSLIRDQDFYFAGLESFRRIPVTIATRLMLTLPPAMRDEVIANDLMERHGRLCVREPYLGPTGLYIAGLACLANFLVAASAHGTRRILAGLASTLLTLWVFLRLYVPVSACLYLLPLLVWLEDHPDPVPALVSWTHSVLASIGHHIYMLPIWRQMFLFLAGHVDCLLEYGSLAFAVLHIYRNRCAISCGFSRIFTGMLPLVRTVILATIACASCFTNAARLAASKVVSLRRARQALECAGNALRVGKAGLSCLGVVYIEVFRFTAHMLPRHHLREVLQSLGSLLLWLPLRVLDRLQQAWTPVQHPLDTSRTNVSPLFVELSDSAHQGHSQIFELHVPSVPPPPPQSLWPFAVDPVLENIDLVLEDPDFDLNSWTRPSRSVLLDTLPLFRPHLSPIPEIPVSVLPRPGSSRWGRPSRDQDIPIGAGPSGSGILHDDES